MLTRAVLGLGAHGSWEAWSHILPDMGGVEGPAWFYPKVKWGAWLRVGTTSVSEMGILVGSGSSLLNPLGIGDDREWGPAFPAINYASRSDGLVELCEHAEQRARSLPQPGSGSCAVLWLPGVCLLLSEWRSGGGHTER